MTEGMVHKSGRELEEWKRDSEVKDVTNEKPNKQPFVLVGGPITEHKIYCSAQFMAGLKKLTYENKVVVLVDNSPTNALREAITRFDIGCPFYVLVTPNRAYARQRLVEGRNLLRDIMLKTKDLSSYELSEEDEKKARELQQMDFEYFLSIEQDVIPPTNTIEELMKHDKDIVEAVYFNSKKLPNNSITIIPMAWNWADPQVKELELLIDIPMEYLLPSRVFAVAAIGLGCCLMKKEVLEKMTNTLPVKHRFKNLVGNTTEEKKGDLQKKIDELKEEMFICTPGSQVEYKYEKIDGMDTPVQVISKGFRYDKEKYACDDMFFSLDTSKVGYDLYINSYLWCQHFHQQWDIQQVGER